MKKIISIGLCLCLMLTFGIHVYAVDPVVAADVSAARVSAGEEVTVSVSIVSADPFNSVGIQFDYDNKVFESLTANNCTWGNISDAVIKNFDGTTAAAMYMSSVSKTGTILEVPFTVKADATGGVSTISISVRFDNNSVKTEAITSTIVTVICSEHTYSDDSDAQCNNCGYIREIAAAMIGDVSYGTLESALAAVQSGQTVKLCQAADMSDKELVKIPADTVLDLNGNYLVSDLVISFGAIVDSSQGEGGVIMKKDVSSDMLLLQPDNASLALYDAENGCYRLFDYSLISKGVRESGGGARKFGTNINLPNEMAYALLAKEENADVELRIDFAVGTHEFTYIFAPTLFEKFADAVLADFGAKDGYAIVLNMYGVDQLAAGTEIVAIPMLTSVVGTARTADAMMFTVEGV